MTDQSQDRPWYLDVVIPGLLRAARNTYAVYVREALAAGGFDDMPKNGPYVLGSLVRSGAPLAQIIKELAVSKQAAGQLIDTLVLRGYLDREVDPADRRRLTLSLTERGRAAQAASASAVERIDDELAKRLPEDVIVQGRVMLAALCGIGRDAEGGGED